MSDTTRYKVIYFPSNIRSDKRGYVYEHYVIAEQILKRQLKPEEVVHHIDENKRNNSKENIMVFASRSDHASYHKGGAAWSYDGLVWYSKKIKVRNCKLCGKRFPVIKELMQPDCKFCSSECSNKSRNVCDNKKLLEIQKLLFDNNGNFSAVGRLLNVSSSGIAKLLKTKGLKHKSSDYKINSI